MKTAEEAFQKAKEIAEKEKEKFDSEKVARLAMKKLLKNGEKRALFVTNVVLRNGMTFKSD